MNPNDIEETLSKTASALGVSASKLRAIYARGVAECLSEGYSNPPYVHGLVRVQRFAVASATNNPRMTPDSDFFPENTRKTGEESQSYEISSNSWPLVYSFMSEDGSAVAEALGLSDVESMVYDTDTQELCISGGEWALIMNMNNQDYKVLI